MILLETDKPKRSRYSFPKGTHTRTEYKPGDKHRNWRGGRWKMKLGYIWVYAPTHPRAYRKGIYEHILVAEGKIGRYLNKGECVHHINHIKDDNRPENLVVFPSIREHLKNHTLNRWSRKHERCSECQKNNKKHYAVGLCIVCYRRKSNKKYRSAQTAFQQGEKNERE